MSHFPIPKVIVKNIKNALFGEMRRLAVDIAKTLDADPNLLLKELNEEKVDFYPFEEEDEPDLDEMHCHAYMKKDNIYHPCSNPPVYPQLFCIKHLHEHITIDKIKDHEKLNILTYDNITYYHDKKNRVYDSEFKLIGIYKKESNLIVLFKHDS